jgi:hypothetical protein
MNEADPLMEDRAVSDVDPEEEGPMTEGEAIGEGE